MKKKKKIKNFFISSLLGILIGFLNGFFGGGGGIVCVPVLENFLKLESKKAHATAIACILPLSIVSGIVYILKNDLKYFELGMVTIGVILGGIAGALLLKKLSNKTIRIIFAIIMLIAGIRMVI